MYIDSKIFEQSTNLILKTAYLYYQCFVSQADISKQLGISVPTVSRLLKKARKQDIVQFIIPTYMTECLDMENILQKRFGLKEVVIAPLDGKTAKAEPEEVKKMVALEGARYIQRVIMPNDILGVAWGGTMWYLYNYLNPSQRVDMEFVTLHGTLQHTQNKFDASWLVPRIAKAFGGRTYSINCRGFQSKAEDVELVLQNSNVKKVYDRFQHITISISGVGVAYPQKDSILVVSNYLTHDELKELERAGVCGDLIFRFFDKEGKECDSSLKSKAVGISWDDYRRIPTKIIVASGRLKADAVLALLKGKLVDVLIIDQELACEIRDRL